MKHFNPIKLTYLSISIFLMLACSTVPITGRKQFAAINDAELAKMSFSMYNQVLDTVKLSKNASDVAMIKNCGERIANAVELYLASNNLSHLIKNFQWEFNLIESNVANAWCMPGGKVAFYTGILPICQSEKGVAVVMGHEIAHAIARHGNERMTQGMGAQVLGLGLSLALNKKPTHTKQVFMQAFGIGSTVGILAFSRKHESEADRMGLIFMAMAGYDPHEAPKLWERMAEKHKNSKRPPVFLSTHPTEQRRIQQLNEWMPEAMNYYTKYK